MTRDPAANPYPVHGASSALPSPYVHNSLRSLNISNGSDTSPRATRPATLAHLTSAIARTSAIRLNAPVISARPAGAILRNPSTLTPAPAATMLDRLWVDSNTATHSP